MDFEQAAALATAWVDIVCGGRARIVRPSTIAKPYGWVFFYQAKEYLDNGVVSAALAGNAPIIIDRNTLELRVTGTAKPLEDYLEQYKERSRQVLFSVLRDLRLGNHLGRTNTPRALK